VSTAINSRAPRARLFDFSDVGTAQLLGGIIVLSFLGRLAAGWVRATPNFFPDEYLYAELGRSIAEGSGPLVRDAFSVFPSLLHPLLTSPFWLIDDVETAFRAIQAFDAALMSLAALPAFAIARQLDLPRAWALLVAGSALLVPDLLLSSWLVAEPLAYPLVLASVWACVRAIRRPSALNQLALLSLLGLTTLARFQLVVVPIAVLATFVVVGIRERRPICAVREQWLVASVAAASLALGAVLLGTGQLGPYSGALKLNLDPIGIASWAAPTALVLAYATGWLVIPGALIGLVVGVARPKSRAEGTVCVLTLLLGLGLLAQAGFVSNTITAELHERYVFYLSPLLAISFGTWLHRGAPGARRYAALVTGLGLVALLVPLSRYSAAEGKTDSAFLRALGGLENLFADVGTASAAVAAASILGCVAALFAYRSGAAGLRMLWIGALIVGVATSAGAVAFDRGNALRTQRDFVGSSPSWIDRLDVD
jgi:hypothetical protein